MMIEGGQFDPYVREFNTASRAAMVPRSSCDRVCGANHQRERKMSCSG